MAFLNNQTWYCGSTKYAAVTQWAASTSYTAGQIRSQLATPAVGSERCFVCIIPGTSGSSEPTWSITRGSTTTDGTVTWMECTGRAGVNGDTTNCSTWNAAKGTAVSQGVLIYDSTTTSLQIATTPGTAGGGSAPSFSATAGTTTADNTVTWTSLGLASGFAAWAAPWARLNLALATGFFVQSGDQVFVSNNHAATQAAAINYNALNISGAVSVLCINDAATPPTSLATGATESTTGANSIAVGNTEGKLYGYGISFPAGSGSSLANIIVYNAFNNATVPAATTLDNCTFQLNNTNATSSFSTQNYTEEAQQLWLKNCTWLFGSTSQKMFTQSNNKQTALISNGKFAPSGSVPSTLMQPGFTFGSTGSFVFRNSDLSAIAGTVVNVSSLQHMDIQFQNCKLNASATLVAGSFSDYYSPKVRFHNCDSAATQYNYYYQNNLATATVNTSIYRTNGAINNGTPYSLKVVTTTNPGYFFPFISEDIVIPCSFFAGSHTVTVYLASNVTLTNAQAWIDVEYLSSSTCPLGAVTSTKAPLIGSPTALTTDSSVWNGSAPANLYSITCTFSPLLVGWIKVRLNVAVPSATIYFDIPLNRNIV